MNTESEPLSLTARSGIPSPLKSADATNPGALPVATVERSKLGISVPSGAVASTEFALLVFKKDTVPVCPGELGLPNLATVAVKV